MATKKQKREAAQAKREAFLAEVKADGLKAQERDKQHQQAEEERINQIAGDINARHRAILEAAEGF
jgi:hypothetical protein